MNKTKDQRSRDEEYAKEKRKRGVYWHVDEYKENENTKGTWEDQSEIENGDKKPKFLTGEGIDQIKLWIRAEFEGVSNPELSKCPPSLVAALKTAVIKEAIRNSTGLRGVGDLRTVSGANSPKKEGGGS